MQNEALILSEFACKSADPRGRELPEAPDDIRTDFQRDRDRIIHCRAFRRLKHKTQVFLIPHSDHYRTRLTHTLEVSQISRTVARALGLNEDLTEAIALGHDLGHTPFGHDGERALNEIMPGGFSHNMQGKRVVQVIEKDGRGLNLTAEVIDGIQGHSTSGGASLPFTREGMVVRLCDKIAYINHDIEDAIRGGVFGAVSFYDAVTGASAMTGALFQVSPVNTFILCVGMRVLMGLCTGLIFNAVKNFDKPGTWSYIVSAMCAPALNTLFFMGYIVLAFYGCDYVQNLVSVKGAANPLMFVVLLVGVQGVAEFLVSGILGGIVARAVHKFLK